MKFWEAMREMQENGKNVRCKRWDPHYEWHLGDDINLPDGCDWEDVLYEWELYEEPAKNYSFAEVVKGLREGKKFVRKQWIIPEAWVEADVQGNIHFVDERRLPFVWTIRDVETNDWVLVE